MVIALALFAVVIVIASGSGVLFPAELLSFAREAFVGPGMWWAAGARLLLAVLLWFSAPVSRTPITFMVLAALALLGALFIVAVGADGVLEILDWMASWPLWVVRLDASAGMAFGVFMLWSVSGKRADVRNGPEV